MLYGPDIGSIFFVSFHYVFKVWRVKTRRSVRSVNSKQRHLFGKNARNNFSILDKLWRQNKIICRIESAHKDWILCSLADRLLNENIHKFVNSSECPMGVASKVEVCGNLCQCQHNNSNNKKVWLDSLFSPIKKMRVLKKIKKRMGLGRFKAAINDDVRSDLVQRKPE